MTTKATTSIERASSAQLSSSHRQHGIKVTTDRKRKHALSQAAT